MKRSKTSLALTLIVLFTLACYIIGCTASGLEESFQAKGKQAEGKQAEGKQADKGDFKAVYGSIKNKEYARFQSELQKEKILEAMVTDLNSALALPADISITFTECGEINAFYNPENRRISICYELIENLYDVFSEHEKSQDALDDAVVGATIFILYHELGHALIHVLDLPITGKEEDAVDQLSTFILTDGTDEGEKAALDGARSFFLAASEQGGGIEDLAFWDEHSLDLQRFYNIICLIYGQNEAKYSHLVSNDILPGERAARCPGEYAQVEKAWTTLLKPHLKQ